MQVDVSSTCPGPHPTLIRLNRPLRSSPACNNRVRFVMHYLSELLQQVMAWILPIAERLGAPGLALIAFLDSSFLSLPQVGDALIVALTIQHPERWMLYSAATTLGSTAGCFVLYTIARKGGEAFLRRRFSEKQIDRGLGLFRRHGLLAVIVP